MTVVFFVLESLVLPTRTFLSPPSYRIGLHSLDPLIRYRHMTLFPEKSDVSHFWMEALTPSTH